MAEITPIAVIGIGCRFPGDANSPEELWSLLSEGRTGLREIPTDRWNAESFYHPDETAREAINTKKGYFLNQDVSQFDARFFGFSSTEADQTDPQQRIVLETAYEALENAGIPIESIKGSNTSVYVSVFARDYDRMTWKDVPQVPKYAISGNGEAILAARISYVFDLKGGAMTIDTGCSGSMVAIHQACMSLKTGESNMAIAGGTELLLHPDQWIPWSYNGMANSEGQCYAFDSRGSGYGRGEGVGTVILKRLSDAIADGDPIQAVILNSGINQDGKTNGIMLPSALAQTALVKQVYESANLDPAETMYVEAHGTGTKAGDSAEIQSISEAICGNSRKHDLYVGSVKSNIGHLEASSGIAGFIKAVMVLKKQQIPPQPNFIAEKPGLDLARRRIKIAQKLTPLLPPGYTGPHRVSISSYGYGGTNAHAILQSYSHKITNGAALTNGHAALRAPLLFPLTANSEAALVSLPDTLKKWLAKRERTYSDLQNLSNTLSSRRSLFRWRSVVSASTADELKNTLESQLPKTRAAISTSVTFVFTGQGAQWFAMGHELISTSPVFKASLVESDKILTQFGCEWNVIDELSKTNEESKVTQGEFSQPLTTIIQIALVDLYASFGIRPQYVVGHSSGEIAAAYAAGLRREGAIQAAFFRGIFSAKAAKVNSVRGAMLAVACGEQTILPLMKIASSQQDRITIACFNSPESVTISGDEPVIKELEAVLEHTGISHRKLKVDTAYHSHHMGKVADAYLDSLRNMPQMDPDKSEDVKFFSSVTGEIRGLDFRPSYWIQNLVSPVRFSESLKALAEDMSNSSPATRDHANIVIEIGPHSALQGPIRQTLSQIPNFKFNYCPSLVRGKDAARTTFASVARLFELGYSVDLKSVLNMQHSAHVECVDDLAPYPWDHSTSYWRESRLSRDHRMRKFPYHDLLGLLDVMSPLYEPRWRYHVSVDRLPWLSHHIVEGQIIWPGTGYICMTLEAMKQLTRLRSPGSTIARLTLKDYEVRKPVIVPSEEIDGKNPDVELQLVLSRSNTSEDSSWESVRVLSILPDGSWVQNFAGLIRVDLESATKPGEPEWVDDENEFELSQSIQALDRIKSLAKTVIDPLVLYANMREVGNDFGPSFATLSSVSVGKCVGVSKMIVPDIGLYMPGSVYQSHTIHPAVLDVTNHVLGLLFHEECSRAPIMPTATAEFKITGDAMIKSGEELLIACEIIPKGKRSAKGNSWVFQQTGGSLKLICTISEVTMVVIGETADSKVHRAFQRKKNYRVGWRDDINLMTELTFHKLVTSAFVHPSDRLSIHDEFTLNDKAAAIWLERAIAKPISRSSDAVPHLEIFQEWVTNFLSSDRYIQLLEDLKTESDKDELLQRSFAAGVEGQMLSQVGNNLHAILSGQIHPLSVMVENDLLNKIYMDGPLAASNKQAAEFVRLLAHKKGHMKVLEIGAGTGGTTSEVLPALGGYGGTILEKYTYTDISAGFFEHAAAKFSKWKRFLEFKVLDVSTDPIDLGFEANSYDLIVASNVIHATPLIANTLANVRKLLKPGGQFVLVEMTRSTVAVGMIFGTLSGWWTSEDGRKGSPLLSQQQWHSTLQQAGFSGVDYAAYDDEGPLARTCVMVSKAIDIPHTNGFVTPKIVKIISGSSTPISTSIGTNLSVAFEAKDLQCFSESWDTWAADDEENAFYVVLDSADNPVLANPSAVLFDKIKSILTTCRNILWISYQELDNPHLTAMKGLIVGTARVLRRENAGMRFITLDVQGAVTEGEVPGIVKSITTLASANLLPENHLNGPNEHEYSLREGRLMIPRLHTDTEFNQWADSLNGDEKTNSRLFQGGSPLKLEVQIPGLLSSLCFAHDPLPSLPLQDDEIQLEARAFGVNFRDVFIALGQMPPNTPMAGEISGVVTALGSGSFVQNTYKVGDRVTALRATAYSSHPRVKGVHAQKLPESLDFLQGASIYAVFWTAYYGLVEVARLQKGQKVLIHSASGGVGQAAIQLAQHLGTEVFATVGNAEKRRFISQEYNIPEGHIFSSRGSPRSLKRKLLQLTANRGVNVVLNSMAGEMLAESWECLAPLGYHIELGKADMYKKSYLAMAPFDRNLTFSAVDVGVLLTEIPEKVFEILGKVLQLFEHGILNPVRPLNVLPIGQIEPAFRLIAERKHMGKVILEARDDSLVNAIAPPPSPLKLDSRGTYIIAGGLGDLGQRISCLLAGFGARHIVSLSRRTLDKNDQDKLERMVEQAGGSLHIVQCDITDIESVKSVAEFCRSSLPPVKGIIHGGMVLKDRPLANMKVEDWKAALGPKVTGTINLDNVFWSTDLDFFITLSSVSGITGRLAQSNYSAGNNFQDAFVHERNGKTQARYFTVNIGAILGSHSIESMTDLRAKQELVQANSMTFMELFQVLQYAMDPTTAFASRAQSAMGFDRQSLMSQDEFALANPFFALLPHVEDSNEEEGGAAASTRDIGAMLRNAKSMEEAAETIAEAIQAKFVTFLNCDIEDISLDVPLSSFGMDSLVSIELKNWIMRVFSVTLQASELTGPGSLAALSYTLAARSTLIPDEIRGVLAPGETTTEEKVQKPTFEPAQELAADHGHKCCQHFKTLPRQPIPDLEESYNRHVENVAHFATDAEELEDYRVAIKEFTTPGSRSHRIYERLLKEHNDPNNENWTSDYLLKHIHMKWRPGIPFTSFLLLMPDSKVPHSQAERAALLITATFDYKQAVEEGRNEASWLYGTPQCKYFYGCLFNTNREPAIGSDVFRKYDSAGNYCIVLRRGHVFQIPLQRDGVKILYEEIKTILEAILEQIQDETSWAGILTSDNRDTWAKKREILLAMSPKNQEYLRIVEEAAFTVNLDEGKPSTITERLTQGLLDNGGNRWWDKPLQLIVTANGKSGLILEHSHIDGTTASDLLYRLRDVIEAHKPQVGNGIANGVVKGNSVTPLPVELRLVTNAEVDDHINILCERYADVLSQREIASHTTSQISRNLLIAHSMPIKSIFELVIQLAIRIYYGHNIDSWEGVSLAHFHKGRHDMIQTISPVVAEFCASAADEALPLAQRKELMLRAASDMSANIKNATQGKGHFRLHNVMSELWPKDEPRPAYISHPLWQRVTTLTLAVTLLDPVSPGAATMPANSQALRIRYGVGESDATFSILGPKGKVQGFSACLEEAATIVKSLVLAN